MIEIPECAERKSIEAVESSEKSVSEIFIYK